MTAGSSRSFPAAAPGQLAVVQQFLNTLHVEKGTDVLADADAAYAWLAAAALGQPNARLGADDLDRLRLLRRELRALCGDGAPDAARFAELSASAPLRAALDTSGQIRLAPSGSGTDAALATLLAIVLDAQRDGTWQRLKICRHDRCRWAFYDQSRSRTATWCAMGICGNRTKVASYRRRHLQT